MNFRLIAILFLAGTACCQTIPTNYSIHTLAGSYSPGDGGLATAALFTFPSVLVFAPNGNLYVGEYARVRRIATDGTVTTVAGDGTPYSSGDGGPATQATLVSVTGLALDRIGNLYISDFSDCRVRRVKTSGIIETFAGNGKCLTAGDGGQATSASINGPAGLAFDNSDNLLIAEAIGSRVRSVTPAGTIATVAGTGDQGNKGDQSPAKSATLGGPFGVAVDASGNIYIADTYFCQIRKVDRNSIITTLVGGNACRSSGDGGPLTSATIAQPIDVKVDSHGFLYLSEDFVGGLFSIAGVSSINRVRRIDLTAGTISNFAGANFSGPGYLGDGGPATAALLANPSGLGVDSLGNVAIADTLNQRIRLVNAKGIISTIGGRFPFAGDGGPATDALLFGPDDVALAPDGSVLVVDQNNQRIRRISSTGQISTIAGASPYPNIGGTGGSATAANLLAPIAITTDAMGNIYFTESFVPGVAEILTSGKIIAAITPEAAAGPVCGVAVEPAGKMIYYSIPSTNSVYKFDVASGTTTVFAGSGKASPGFSGDGGFAVQALLSNPCDIALDSHGSLLIGDFGNNRIRKVLANGTIQTVAGNGSTTSSGDGGLAPAAGLDISQGGGVATDSDGNVYISGGARIRRVSAATGVITTIAGTGVPGFSGDGGLATKAQLKAPAGLRVAPDGTIYVADVFNHRVRTLKPLVPASLEIRGGDNQSGPPSSVLPLPLTVRVSTSDGTPFPGITVVFAVSSGTAALSAAQAVTDNNGQAQTSVTLGAVAGPINVTASAAGLPTVIFTLSVISPNAPLINAGGIVTSGNFGGAPVIAPGGWMEVYGSNLSLTTRSWRAEDFDSGTAPTSLDRVQVLVNGKPAFVQLVSPGQINAQAPDGVTGDSASVVVINTNGASAPLTVSLAARAPALLAPPSFRVGGRQYAVALFSDNSTFVGQTNLIPGAAFRPGKAGDHIILYGVSFGSTNPPIPAGHVVTEVTSLPNFVVKFGDIAATVEFAGLAGNAVGLYQLNLVVPPGVTGDAELNVVVDGVRVSQTLYLTLE